MISSAALAYLYAFVVGPCRGRARGTAAKLGGRRVERELVPDRELSGYTEFDSTIEMYSSTASVVP